MKRMTIIFVFGGVLWLLSVIFAYPATFPTMDAPERKTFGAYKEHSVPSIYYARRAAKGHAAAAVSFEALRMLSTGMTKAEVLSRVGSPHHTFKKSRVWVYSATDNWIVQLNFVGERVIGIDWSRP